ncbi:MAG TPA: HypC/HybG/HupF family hydrogenase formation chaperone [Thermoanaerobaculia bacterium]|nr:HypC/HybG/HupF family hydrogenase formation chaperone [Thermoanaerobaculia bacterium]HUM28830.1 HypC/HybG/HupF family hydrogenase formation chaperone [Thermoanaerobaculia bacterium]HXK69087.1 HypC/HybG/HupF family hydrogenase formation chaperone [Thermoanaerobaculia bacterium]
MCLAVPMKLIERADTEGVVELNGVQRTVSLMLLPDARVGNYLLIHAGYALSEIDETEARETLALLGELAACAEEA